MAYSYNYNPSTQTGSGTYGSVAGATDIPDVYQQLSDIYPNLSNTNSAASNALLSQLTGALSNDTVNSIQDAAARFGITSGMGTSGLSKNLSLRDIGLNSQDLQNQGLQNYNNVLSTVKSTQTVSPETQISTAQSNAALAAEATPSAAASYALSLYNQYLDKLTKTGSGSTGGTSTPTIQTNAGGSGTTQPYQTGVISGAPGGGSGYGVVNDNSGVSGAYVPVTGNTYGGYVDAGSTPSNNATSEGSMFTGTQDEYDWEAMLAEYGL